MADTINTAAKESAKIQKDIPYIELLKKAQEYLAKKYSMAMSGESKKEELQTYISKYLHDTGFRERGIPVEQTVTKLFRDMSEYSILTEWLERDDLEEINVNSWDDISILFSDGHKEKMAETFYSPEFALDVLRRLLQQSDMIIDDAQPIAQGHLAGNKRITTIIPPVIDKDAGASCSIRFLHPSTITGTQIMENNTCNKDMYDFMSLCIRYGISFIVAGATGSGKTTLLNAVLGTIPDDFRIYTIETGARELMLIRRNEKGKIMNNVVNTLSRPSDNPNYDIKQEDLVKASLRFNPDVIVVGEMRDAEAHSAVEASLSGHTVVSTIHSFASASAYTRLAILAQKASRLNYEQTISETTTAFPIIIYCLQLEDNSRKVMDISECIGAANGRPECRTLFQYAIHESKTNEETGETKLIGSFEQVNSISHELMRKLMQSGAPMREINRYYKPKKEGEA